MPLCCRYLPAAIALIGAGLLPGLAPAQEEATLLEECEVIARVNSEVILACELEWQIQLMFEDRFGREQAKQLGDSPLVAAVREAMLKNLAISRLEIALLYADFRSTNPQADVGAIKKQLETPWRETEMPRLMESVKVETPEELEPRLLELGTSLGERREDFFRTMIARSWLTQSTKIDREVTHEQMLEYYHDHEADYHQPDRARWEELMVRFDKHPDKAAAYAALAGLGNQAYAAASQAAVGSAAFAQIAPGASDGFTAADGGEYDWTTRGSLAADSVDTALFTLAVGEMSPILEGPLGFHIVRVLERKDAGPTPFRDVQAQIRGDIQDERFKVAINERLTALKKSARMWTVFTGDLDYEKLAELQAPKDTQTR